MNTYDRFRCSSLFTFLHINDFAASIACLKAQITRLKSIFYRKYIAITLWMTILLILKQKLYRFNRVRVDNRYSVVMNSGIIDSIESNTLKFIELVCNQPINYSNSIRMVRYFHSIKINKYY